MEIAAAVPVATYDAPQSRRSWTATIGAASAHLRPVHVQSVQRETGAGHLDATLTVRSDDPDGG